MILLVLISNGEEDGYREEARRLVELGGSLTLLLNSKKTKEGVDFRKARKLEL